LIWPGRSPRPGFLPVERRRPQYTDKQEIPVRIRRLDKSEVDQTTSDIFDVYLKERGNIPNMFRTVAHRPEHLRTMIAHFRTVMNTGTVPPKLKELLSVRVSQINACEY
jgi:alkylhydroperoxidase family enzyme